MWKLLRVDRRASAPLASGFARVLSVASGKGGTGKSICATNLAVVRAERGARVCLIDFDAGMANAHLLFGVAPRFDLGHVLDGEVRAEDALIAGPAGVQLLSGGVGRHALANPTRRELERLFGALEALESEFDLIVIDHGAGLSYPTLAHLAAASALLIVTSHEVTALSDAYAMYKHTSTINPGVRVGLAFNRVPDESAALGSYERFRGAALRFLSRAPELVGWIPNDAAVGRSVQARWPVVVGEPDSPAARGLLEVASWCAIDELPNHSSFYAAAGRSLR